MIVEFSVRALQDLQRIAAYYDEISFSAGDRVIHRLWVRCRALQTHPRRGARLKVAPGREFRRLVEAPFVIVYEVAADVVRIGRILHGARDIEAILNDDGDT